ncbi:uncharacterized protein N7483_010009 [Penicillium malachiteum]|uniref:uncharacterized protein n=1 Tax=Penicillium malachiteum TaxID=1324776 RepID=UPI002549B919|nr:uncharacterized protein N7483_010009 [Penicillium malachiteum]KAJ5718927.1 hypothetical protein N7483_010009 [Penicillium malachiteum]
MSAMTNMNLFNVPYKPACATKPPGWGELPVEPWLVRRWNKNSAEPAAEQRARLIPEYLSLPTIPRGLWDPVDSSFRHLTIEDINKVLKPWRPQEVRGVANALWTARNYYPPLVRSYYEPNNHEHNMLMDLWVSMGHYFQAEKEWIVINDPVYYPGGTDQMADWKNIFLTLPELAGPAINRSETDSIRYDNVPPKAEYRRDLFKAQLAVNKYLKPHLWYKDKVHMIESCAAHIHRAMCYKPLIIVDRQAFETGYPLLVYMDYFGDVIRQTRFDLNEETLLQVIEDWLPNPLSTKDTSLLTPWMWYQSEVSTKYKVQDPKNLWLYEVTDVDLEDPTEEDSLSGGEVVGLDQIEIALQA